MPTPITEVILMRCQSVKLGTLVIALNATDTTTAIDLTDKPLRGLSIFAPAALTGAVLVYVSGDAGVSYQVLQIGGTDVAVAAGKCVIIDVVAFDFIKVTSGSAEAAARTFVVRGYEEF